MTQKKQEREIHIPPFLSYFFDIVAIMLIVGATAMVIWYVAFTYLKVPA